MAPDPVLEVRNLVKRFDGAGGEVIHAVDDVSFTVQAGEILGLVGESGCGKSTTIRSILQAPRPTSGSVRFAGHELTELGGAELRRVRRGLQLVFQDPHASLDPRWAVRRSIAEPLAVHGVGARADRFARADELLDLVGLDPALYGDRRPGQLSGGQCQRVAIARALALDPQLILFDEAVSSLDVSIQAQILNLISRLRRQLSLTSIFIAHDLAVVRHVSDRVGVMYLGRLVEVGPVGRIFSTPIHHYTAALLSSVPKPDPTHAMRGTRIRLEGDLPSPANPPPGCHFAARCPAATERCRREQPALATYGDGHEAACHHPREVAVELSVGPEAVRSDLDSSKLSQ